MSSEFASYAAIATAACLVSALLVGRKVLDPGRAAGWYLAIFFVTYVIRPAGSQVYGDIRLYQWLGIGAFEPYWIPMTIAVSGAILSFALGYRLAPVTRASKQSVRGSGETSIVAHDSVIRFAKLLMVWGYLALVATLATGAHVERAALPGVGSGINEHSTAWLTDSELFVSTGSVIYYIATGRLGTSLLIASPWLAHRITDGWGRINIIAYFFSLMAVYFSRIGYLGGRRRTLQLAVIGVAVAITVLVLFPLLGVLRTLQREGYSLSDLSPQVVRSMTSKRASAEAWFGTESDLAGFEESAYYLAIDEKATLGVDYFWQYFIRPVPRVLWPGKGLPITWIQALRGIPYDPRVEMIGMAPGSVGVAFREWRWFGIVLEFVLTGVLFRAFEEWARRKPEAAYAQLAYVGLFSLIPQLGRDSIIYLIAYRYLFVTGIPLVLLFLIHKRRESFFDSGKEGRAATSAAGSRVQLRVTL